MDCTAIDQCYFTDVARVVDEQGWSRGVVGGERMVTTQHPIREM